LSTGAKAGIGVGVSLAALIALAFGICFLCYRKKTKQRNSKTSGDTEKSVEAGSRGQIQDHPMWQSGSNVEQAGSQIVELEAPQRDTRSMPSELPSSSASPRIREDDNPEVLQAQLRRVREDRERLERMAELRRIEEDLERRLSAPRV
jgi:hypothetical protein